MNNNNTPEKEDESSRGGSSDHDKNGGLPTTPLPPQTIDRNKKDGILQTLLPSKAQNEKGGLLSTPLPPETATEGFPAKKDELLPTPMPPRAPTQLKPKNEKQMTTGRDKTASNPPHELPPMADSRSKGDGSSKISRKNINGPDRNTNKNESDKMTRHSPEELPNMADSRSNRDDSLNEKKKNSRLDRNAQDNSVHQIPSHSSGQDQSDDGPVETNSDVESPAVEATVIEADVAPDIDAVVQRAVENALQERDQNLARATVAAENDRRPNRNEDESTTMGSSGKGTLNRGEERMGRRKQLILVGAGVVILVVGVVLAVTLSTGRDTIEDTPPSIINDTIATGSPAASPTMVPSVDVIASTMSPSLFPTKLVNAPPSPDTVFVGFPQECEGALEIVPGQMVVVSKESLRIIFTDPFCLVFARDFGIWFSVQPQEDYVGRLKVDNLDFPARLSVYAGDCEDPFCEDRTFDGGYDLSLDIQMDAGTRYHVFVAQDGDVGVGGFTLSLEALFSDTMAPSHSPVLLPTESPTPFNSGCINATNVTPGFSETYPIEAGFDTFSNSECGVGEGNLGLWFRYTPSYKSIVTVSITEQSFSAMLSYYSGSCQSLTCEQRTIASFASTRQLSFLGLVGEEYYFLASDGGIIADGGATMKFSLEAPPPPPTSFCTSPYEVDALPYFARHTTIGTVPTTTSSVECDISVEDRGSWYSYRPIQDEILNVTISNLELRTRVAFFTGEGRCDSLVCPYASPGSGLPQSLILVANPATSYFLLVVSDGFDQVGAYDINITATPI